MNNSTYQEPQSLLEVWQWKEQVYEETKDLTYQEYLKRLEKIAEHLKEQYHVNLQKVSLPSFLQKPC